MLKLVSFHIQAHLNAFLQILEYFSQIFLGPLARESPCTIKARISSPPRSRDRISVGSRFSALVRTSPGAQPVSCKMGTVSFPVVKSGRGVTLTPHPLLVPWSRKSRVIPLPPWAVRLVQILSACARVHFTFTSSPPTHGAYIHQVRLTGLQPDV